MTPSPFLNSSMQLPSYSLRPELTHRQQNPTTNLNSKSHKHPQYKQ